MRNVLPDDEKKIVFSDVWFPSEIKKLLYGRLKEKSFEQN